MYNVQGQCLCLRSHISSVSEALSPGDLHALVSTVCTYTSKFKIMDYPRIYSLIEFKERSQHYAKLMVC